MRAAIILVSLLPAIALNTPSAFASLPASLDAVRASQAPVPRLAQRQPGGLPGMSEGEEEARPGAKGGPPARSRQADPPMTRSLETPKAPGRSNAGPAAGEKSDKKAKKSPDGAN